LPHGADAERGKIRSSCTRRGDGRIARTRKVWLREIGWKWLIPVIASLLLDTIVNSGLVAALLAVYFLAGALSVVVNSDRGALWDHLGGTEVRRVMPSDKGDEIQFRAGESTT
jgi:hypothetical protein